VLLHRRNPHLLPLKGGGREGVILFFETPCPQ
jgi:hypothetical protein